MSAIEVGPSAQRVEEWTEALHRGDDAALERLMAAEPPGVSHFHLMVFVNGVYRQCQMLGVSPILGAPQVERVLEPLANIRAGLGALEQRALDLGLLRWIRRSSALSLVEGAGVTMDAGGPSWPELVDRLLEICLTRGREISEMRASPANTETQRSFTRHVTDVVRFEAEQERDARAIRAAIAASTADPELLQHGVELCHSLMGQSLFADVTQVLYDGGRRATGSIHRAVAELCTPQLVPDRARERTPPLFAGWDAILTYNFDDLQGEAIDALGLPRVAWGMRGDDLAGDPNAVAREAGQDAPYQAICHLHGYTPRRFFLITHVKFVLAASQYLEYYQGDPRHVITRALNEHLAHPIKYALYVGCSFQDAQMNELLRQAAAWLPGRHHYAFLKWPGAKPLATASAVELERAAQSYLAFGVRPIWFDSFSEIPNMIRTLQ